MDNENFRLNKGNQYALFIIDDDKVYFRRCERRENGRCLESRDTDIEQACAKWDAMLANGWERSVR